MERIAAPLRRVGLFLVRHLLIPIYRVTFSLRRMVQQVVLPAKHQLAYIISNKYAAHGLMILIVISVGYVNLQARDVRAETFGQQSLLYALVSGDGLYQVEVVEAGDSVVSFGAGSNYLADTVVDARMNIHTDLLGDPFFTSQTGETISPAAPSNSVPARTEVESYLVQDGDTLGQIAERFGLNVTTILWANDLSFTSTIRPGDELQILPTDGVLYTVKSGDTLSSIANKYDVTVDEIMDENNMTSSSTLSIGATLMLAGGEPVRTTTSSTSSSSSSSASTTVRSTTSVAELFTAPATTSPSTGDSGWYWPTDWRVITQYYGWRHTGIDVDGDYGTNSYAARDGVVIYSGWRSGYGLTVEIDHGDGYVTRYAHHASNYVGVGEVVAGGQAIAQTGTTGRSTGTHLHFEIILNGSFQNPLDYVR